MADDNRSRSARLVVACLLGASAGWAITAPGAGARVLAAAYETDLLWVGLMSAALAAPYAALQLPAGVLVDRWGVRRATTAGLSLVLLAHVVALTTPEPSIALVARLLSGVGFAVCFVSGAELARSSGWGSRGMGVFGGVALAASGASVLGVALTEPTLDWRASWATSAVASAAALLGTALLRELPTQRAHDAPTEVATSPPALHHDGELLRLAAIHAATLGLGLVLSTWASTLLLELWSFPAAAAALVGSMVLGLSVISRPLGGQVATVRPGVIRPLWAITLVVCALSTLALAAAGPGAVAIAGVIALGIFSGLPFAAVVQAAQARQPVRRAAAVGLMNTIAFGLVVVGTPAVGWAVDHDHARAALVTIAILWLMPLLALPTPPTVQQPQPA